MESTDNIMAIFARHETFHPRFGWLKKGFDKSIEDSSVFSKESAPVVLGVGKNMVKALRYWCIAFKVVTENKEGGKALHHPTVFGEKLFSDDGWDPYLENPSSLWLLHWNLFKYPCYVPVWYFTFNELNKIDFSADDLLFSVEEYANRKFPQKRIINSSLNKDINCLIRMYVQKTGSNRLKEDSLDCPFTDLALINAYKDSKRFSFNYGSKPTLPPEIIVAACLEYTTFFEGEAKTIALPRLLYANGSPGQVFKLNESCISEALYEVSDHYKELYLTDTAGMTQMSFNTDPLVLSDKILNDYFRKRN